MALNGHRSLLLFGCRVTVPPPPNCAVSVGPSLTVTLASEFMTWPSLRVLITLRWRGGGGAYLLTRSRLLNAIMIAAQIVALSLVVSANASNRSFSVSRSFVFTARRGLLKLAGVDNCCTSNCLRLMPFITVVSRGDRSPSVGAPFDNK